MEKCGASVALIVKKMSIHPHSPSNVWFVLPEVLHKDRHPAVECVVEKQLLRYDESEKTTCIDSGMYLIWILDIPDRDDVFMYRV